MCPIPEVPGTVTAVAPDGTYFARLEVGSQRATQKIQVVRQPESRPMRTTDS